MAVIFDTALTTTELVNSHNNNEVVFRSSLAGNEVSASIDIDGSIFEVQPIGGVFFFNFKQAFIALFPTLFFNDNVEPFIVLGSPTTLLYSYTEIDNDVDVTYTITLDAGGPDIIMQTYMVVQSLLERLDFAKGVDIFSFDFNMLMIPDLPSAFNFSAVYFEGYPFDVTLFTEVTGIRTLTHLETGSTLDLNIIRMVMRLFFSDGRGDVTIDNFIPVLDNTTNTYVWDDPNNITMHIEKIEGNCNGVYLKWKINTGGWAYWLFDSTSEKLNVARSTGELNRDFARYENTGDFNELGKEATTRYRVKTDFLRGKYRRLVTSIVDSPRVYFYGGERFVKAETDSWIPVRLNSQQGLIKARKNEFDPLEFEFELFTKDTLTL